jgi:nucleotide-binding universal stress UspA family protein
VYPSNPSDLARTVIAGYVNTLSQQASQALGQLEAMARAAGVSSFETRLVADDPEGGLVRLSRFCDLLVLSQTDPASPVTAAVRDLPEYVMLNSTRPVLLLPYSRDYPHLGGNALVAWNGSLEAARAVGSALPLLRRAAGVLVAYFDEGKSGELAAESNDLLAWLARHGVKAGLHEQPAGNDAGNALLSLAAERQSDLIVMGCYGHTRFRELMLGGVTRTMLAQTATPVLMSH